MKYITTTLSGVEVIFIFPRTVDHDRFVEGVQAIRFGSEHNWERNFCRSEIISAGFIDNGVCHGRSETLGLESRGDVDTRLLAQISKQAT